MDWFRCYSEFATDPKVQIMPEHMQRRLIMLFCLRCSNVLATLQETEICFALRISEQELLETKALFLQKDFIDDAWNIRSWDKRQYISDTSTERSRKHRENKKKEMQQACNVAATPPEQNRADTEQNIKETEREERALTNFSDLEFSEDWGRGNLDDIGLKNCWDKWKIQHAPTGPGGDWRKSWGKWVLNERKTPVSGHQPASAEKAMQGEELEAQRVGTIVWRKKMNMWINSEQEALLKSYEAKHGKVTWNNAREWREQKKASG